MAIGPDTARPGSDWGRAVCEQPAAPVEAAAPCAESPSQVSRDYDGAEAMYKRALDHVTPPPPSCSARRRPGRGPVQAAAERRPALTRNGCRRRRRRQARGGSGAESGGRRGGRVRACATSETPLNPKPPLLYTGGSPRSASIASRVRIFSWSCARPRRPPPSTRRSGRRLTQATPGCGRYTPPRRPEAGLG